MTTDVPMTIVTEVPKVRRSRAPRGQGEKLRQEILTAAEELLVSTGDETSVSIRAIASAVGVTPPSIYLHFADRNELLFAVSEVQWRRLQDQMEAAVEGIDDPLERITRRGGSYISFGRQHPEQYRILMMSRGDCTPERFADQRLLDGSGMDDLISDVRAAIAAGQLPEQDPLEAATVLWVGVHGLVSLVLSKPDFPFPPMDRLADRLLLVLRNGLGVPV